MLRNEAYVGIIIYGRNRFQNRLEATHSKSACKIAPLNQSHRPQYLLIGLIKCGCCGGGYTIVASATAATCARRKTSRIAATAARSP